MSIASEIAALQQDKADISAALLAKGATLPSGGGGSMTSQVLFQVYQP